MVPAIVLRVGSPLALFLPLLVHPPVHESTENAVAGTGASQMLGSEAARVDAQDPAQKEPEESARLREHRAMTRKAAEAFKELDSAGQLETAKAFETGYDEYIRSVQNSFGAPDFVSQFAAFRVQVYAARWSPERLDEKQSTMLELMRKLTPQASEGAASFGITREGLATMIESAKSMPVRDLLARCRCKVLTAEGQMDTALLILRDVLRLADGLKK